MFKCPDHICLALYLTYMLDNGKKKRCFLSILYSVFTGLNKNADDSSASVSRGRSKAQLYNNFITSFSDLDETGFLFCVENIVSCSAPQLWRGGFTSSSN